MDRQRELFAMSERLKSLDVQNDSQEYKSPLERIIKCIGDNGRQEYEFSLEHIIQCIEDVELQLHHNPKTASKKYGSSVAHS